MITTRDELRELQARIIRSHILGTEKDKQFPWGKLTAVGKEPYLDIAEATMKAEEAEGLAVVPYGATKAMQNAACANFNKVAGLNDAIAAGDILREDG